MTVFAARRLNHKADVVIWHNGSVIFYRMFVVTVYFCFFNDFSKGSIFLFVSRSTIAVQIVRNIDCLFINKGFNQNGLSNIVLLWDPGAY